MRTMVLSDVAFLHFSFIVCFLSFWLTLLVFRYNVDERDVMISETRENIQ